MGVLYLNEDPPMSSMGQISIQPGCRHVIERCRACIVKARLHVDQATFLDLNCMVTADRALERGNKLHSYHTDYR